MTLDDLRRFREDISPDVIHLTRRNTDGLSALQVLQKIVREGFITPTFAPRVHVKSAENTNVIKGNHPAVCFTEQPLPSLAITVQILPRNYEPYGLIFDKRYVYHLGGRPVIYSDDTARDALREDMKYLWSFYNPNLRYDDKPWPVDWTHEREWRFRVPDEVDPLPGFPLNFCEPPRPDYEPVRVLVLTKRDAAEMDCFLKCLRVSPPSISDPGPVQRQYEKGITAARVVCLETLGS
jgi:hypothetical protein